MRFANYLVLGVVALSACSKSPTPADTVGQRLVQPIIQKDASIQAQRMTELVLSDKPECEVFKKRMKDAGKGSPYEGATQWQFVHTQQDACAAGCCK